MPHLCWTPATPPFPPYTMSDAEVFAEEKRAIAVRRETVGRDAKTDNLVGLALSGGGIRSASFSLGVLQALDTRQCIDRIDYLSTVSGGGYMGCCLTACMSQSGTAGRGAPEREPLAKGASQTSATAEPEPPEPVRSGTVPFNEKNDFGDTDAIHHIRDFSNYLMPRGFRDLVTSFGLIGRGLAANALLLAPFFVGSTLLLLLARPKIETLDCPGPIQAFAEHVLDANHLTYIPGFPDTTIVMATAGGLLVVWALARSLGLTGDGSAIRSTEFHGPFVVCWKLLLLLVAMLAWLELQPLVLRVIAGVQPAAEAGKAGEVRAWLEPVINVWFTRAAPILAPIGAVVAFMARQLARTTTSRKGLRATTLVKRLLAKGLILVAALIIPSLIWYLYLLFTLALMPATNSTYIALGIALGIAVIAALLVDPNATSLHQLYRDRLSKAFLFDADCRIDSKDLTAIAPKLHNIDVRTCPFPIINAALNLEGSAFANRRGRNADFFEFSPRYVGSEATGWIDSKTMWQSEPKLDLGTAMAISGAAFSPNMGSATIKPLVPTLALLNMRLGFWLRNPRCADSKRGLWRGLWARRCFLLVREIFGRIDENSDTVYVTDGGNIENLGVHALLRRKCKLIIAVDAEADPAMTFGAYLRLQRYARIDLGVLLDLPWQSIRDKALALNERIAKDQTTPAPSSPGLHIAVGTIRYGAAEDGVLVYVKASMTGDESDYILDYKSRNPDFPHETTGDQFFGEEQLEVYRALGFHIMRYHLDGRSSFEVTPKPNETVTEARKRVMTLIRLRLGLPEPVA